MALAYTTEHVDFAYSTGPQWAKLRCPHSVHGCGQQWAHSPHVSTCECGQMWAEVHGQQ